MLSINKWSTAPLFLFFLTASIYIHHLSQSVYGGDVGDFLSAIAVKGVPHPSGYPLFTIFGIFLSFLPINATLAWKVGIISVFSASFGVVVLYFIVNELTKDRIVSMISALTLAFIHPYWLYAELAEAFSLFYFFVLLLLYVSILYFKRKKFRYLYFLFFFAGLALSHHEFIIVTFPSLFLFTINVNRKVFFHIKTLSICLGFFALGVLPYLYIPIASSFNPAVNWGHVTSLKDFFRLVFRLDYGWGVSAQADTMFLRFLALKIFLNEVLTIFSSAGVLFVILGALRLFSKKQYLLLGSLFLGFFLSGPFFIFYAFTPHGSDFVIGMYERFYMTSILFLLIFFPFGIVFVVNILVALLKKTSTGFSKNIYRQSFMFCFLIVPLSLFIINFNSTDLHDVWIGDAYASDLLYPLLKNSVLLISGDTELFNLLYLQYGRGIRKDVTIVNLNSKDSTIVNKKREIKKKSPDVPNDALNLLAIQSLAKERSVFSNIFLVYPGDKKYGDLEWIPYGLVLKLEDHSDSNLTKEEYLKKQREIWENHQFTKETTKKISWRSYTITDIPLSYAEAYTNTGDFLTEKFKDSDLAKEFYEKALSLNPDSKDAMNGLASIYASKNECKKSEKLYNQIININPYEKTPYLFLYALYNNCLEEPKKSKIIGQNFLKIFNLEIENELNKRIEKK